MSIEVEINTNDVSSEIEFNSLRVRKQLSQGHSCRFEMVGSSSISEPEINDEVIVKEDGDNIFGGRLKI